MKKFLKTHKMEIWFLVFVFVFAGVWAFILPFNASPDEHMRYQIPEYLCEHRTLPAGYDEEIRNHIWGISYAFNPILSYMISAFFMLVVSKVYASPHSVLFAARLVGVLCLMGTAFMVMQTAKRLFKGKERWLFTCGVILLPQMVYLATYVNCDALAMFSTSVIFYAWVCAIQDGWNLKNSILLAVGIAICALSYYNAYGFILCSILLFVATNLLNEKRKGNYKRLFQFGIIITIIVCVLAGWWFIHNYKIYDGDFLGRKASAYYGELYAEDGYKPSQRPTPLRNGDSLWDLLWLDSRFGYPWILLSYLSFIGVFGYVQTRLFNWMYIIYTIFAVGGLAGAIPQLKRLVHVKEDGKWNHKVFFYWAAILASVITVALYVYYAYASDYQFQGRYAMPMLIPLIFFLTKGQARLLNRFIKDEKKRNMVYNIMIGILIALSLISFFFVLIPSHWGYFTQYLEYYYGT